jgi:uncharacterized protein YcnI
MKISDGGMAVLALAMAAAMQLGSSGVAQAHTTIWPRSSTAGAMEKYTLRVPAESQVMSKGAEIDVPEGVIVATIGAPAGWTYEVKRHEGRITSIRWHMDIKPGEFAEFSFVARNPANKSELVWKLREFFADGKVTDFTNGPDGIYPNAVVKLIPN